MSEALQRIEPSKPVAATSDSMVSMFERILMDPSVSIDRLERVWEFVERERSRLAREGFSRAMADMQCKLPVVDERGQIKTSKDANAKPQSTYARWADINEAIMPVLRDHGFSLTFKIATLDKITVTGILTHREGHAEETSITLPSDSGGSKNAVQAVASSVSYGKRYTAGALLNLTSRAKEDADDDGKAAGQSSKTITDDQVTELRDLLFSTGANFEGFLKAAKVEDLADILSKNYGALCQAVRQRETQRKNGGSNAG